MKKNKSIGFNAGINGLKTIVSLVFPLITTPYISRILQVEGVGKYNYSYSIISYFYLIANLGIATYAIREGAKYREDKKKFDEFASQIFSINVLSGMLAYLLLFLTLFFVERLKEYRIIILVLSISIVFSVFGCDWLFSIYEEYLYLAVRSILFQAISLVLMFLFVRTKNDVITYAMIVVIATSGIGLVNAINVHRKHRIVFMKDIKWKEQIIPILIIFANTITTTIYVNSDITILGVMCGEYNVGIYSIATKIYTIIKTVLSAIIIVSIPRLSLYIGKNDMESFKLLGSKIINTLIIIVVPAMVGLFIMSENIVIILSDYTFITAVIPLKILCLALIFCLFGWFFTSCVLIPLKKEKVVLIITIIASFVNIVLNFVLIPFWQEKATAFTTVLAEAISFFACFLVSRRTARIQISIKNVISTIVGCMTIVVYCTFIKMYLTNVFIELLIAVVGSIFIYGCILYLMKNELIIGVFDFAFIKKYKKFRIKGKEGK